MLYYHQISLVGRDSLNAVVLSNCSSGESGSLNDVVLSNYSRDEGLFECSRLT